MRKGIRDIKEIKLYCPFCGRQLERYAFAGFNRDGYALCSYCDREYSPSINGKLGSGQSIVFCWKEGDKRMWEWEKKHRGIK